MKFFESFTTFDKLFLIVMVLIFVLLMSALVFPSYMRLKYAGANSSTSTRCICDELDEQR